jgi:hypothetical protein
VVVQEGYYYYNEEDGCYYDEDGYYYYYYDEEGEQIIGSLNCLLWYRVRYLPVLQGALKIS